MEVSGFTKSPGFLKKIELIQYNTDNSLFSKYKNIKLCLLLPLYADDIFIAREK